MATSVWTFDSPPAAPRAPEVVLLAFSRGPLRDDVPLSVAGVGAPGAASLEALELHAIPRAADPRWFDAWRDGSLRAIAEGDLGAALRDLDAADHVHLVRAAPAAPADLGYLQASWAMVRHLAARGATVVLDAHAATYRPAAAIAPAGAALDVRAEIRVVYETEARRNDRAHALHTRGLRKFGAPDLIALCGDDDAALVGEVVGQLADVAARGVDLGPRHAVALDDATTWYAVDDRDGLGALLQLGNAARVLVDAVGRHLVGVRAGARVN